MTSIRVKSAHFSAMVSHLISIEANFMRGFSGLTLVGSNSEICRGGLLRAQAALENLGHKIPQRKILISLFPADQKKEGNQFDLAFAVCLFALIQKDEKIRSHLDKWLFASELGLDGTLHRIKGVISFALAGLEKGLKGIIVSKENLEELKELRDFKQINNKTFKILSFDKLESILSWLLEEQTDPPASFSYFTKDNLKNNKPDHYSPNFDDMVLSPVLSDIASVVVCGHHNLFISGCPGTGKSMFSQRLASIVPKTEAEEKIETLRIHSSFSNKIEKKILLGHPPFRSPHHSTSTSAILGAENSPGEISLAHSGILFLDEFPEFRKDIIESLREPLETGNITVSRAKSKVSWKSEFILVIAANNCPCGWLGSNLRRCICPSNKIITYKRRLSGPILDRIDIHINMDESVIKRSRLIESLSLKGESLKETTKILCKKVQKGQDFGKERNKKWQVIYNKNLRAEHLMEAFGANKKEFNLLLSQLHLDKLSNRSMLKVLRVARTLADLDLSEKVREADLLKALSWTQDSCAKSRGDLAYGFV